MEGVNGMISGTSLAAARRLRPAGAYHQPPSAQPLFASLDLTVEGATLQPEIILHDTRYGNEWRVAMSTAGNGQWTAPIRLPGKPTIVRYHFTFPDGTILDERRQFEGRNKPEYGQWLQQPFQISVYDPAQMPAHWTR